MRIAFIADTHRTVDSIESLSLYPKRLQRMPENEALKMYNRIRAEVERAYEAAIVWLMANGPWDFVIGLGDLAGGWRERGCAYPLAREIAAETARDIQEISPARFCLGNHETGYSTPSTMAGAGIDEEGVAVCREIFGDLWWKLELPSVMVLGVCSPIAQYSASNKALLELRQEQIDYVRDTLYNTKRPWVLCMHDPATVFAMRKVFRPHIHSLRQVFFGDWHDPRKGKVARLAARWLIPPVFTFTLSLARSVMCPAVAPLWWRGYQLLTVDIDEQGAMVSAYVNIPKPKDSEYIPVSSFWRALGWMLLPEKAGRSF